MDIQERLGQALKKWREDAELSREAVAAKAGVSRQTIDNWESGKQEPRFSQALRMAKLAPGLVDAYDRIVNAKS